MKNNINRETHTKNIMIRMYCRAHHRSETDLCPDCQDLMEYSDNRLEKCAFGYNKPTCDCCTVHCYNVIYRRRIKEVMRFAGPRMIWRHPILAIRHLIQ